MFCRKCGNEIEAGSNFCRVCGFRIDVREMQDIHVENGFEDAERDVLADARMKNSAAAQFLKKNSKKLIIGGAAAAAAIIVICGTVSWQHHTVDLAKYTDIEITGEYNGGAYANASIDSEAEAKIRQLLRESADQKGMSFGDDLMAGIYGSDSLVRCELDADSELSNGDVVTGTFVYDEALFERNGIHITGKTISEKVEGLEETRSVDPFEGMKVTFAGISGEAEPVFSYEGDEDVLRDDSLSFSFDRTEDLKDGDQVTLTVDDYDESYLISNYGVTLSETSKTYEVQSENHFITKVSELGKDVMEEMKARAETTLQSISFDRNALTDAFYKGTYVLSAKSDEGVKNGWGSNIHNEIYLIYTAKVHPREEGQRAKTVYVPVRYLNIAVDSSGEVVPGTVLSAETLNVDDEPVIYRTSYGWERTFQEGYDNGASMFRELITCQKTGFNYDVSKGLKEFGDNQKESGADTKKATATSTSFSSGAGEATVENDEEDWADDAEFEIDGDKSDAEIDGDKSDAEYEVDGDKSDAEYEVDGDKSDAESEVSDKYPEEFVFPYSSVVYLSESDVDGLSLDQLQQAINEICARNGHEFEKPKWKAFFGKYSWYHPVKGKKVNEKDLRGCEKANYKLLAIHRDRLKNN